MRTHRFGVAQAAQLVPWSLKLNKSRRANLPEPTRQLPVVEASRGFTERCGFSFGREGDEEHELWLPVSKALVGQPGQSLRIVYDKGAQLIRIPPTSTIEVCPI